MHLWKILRCNEAVPPVGVASYGRVTWEAPAQTELRPTAPGLLAAHGGVSHDQGSRTSTSTIAEGEANLALTLALTLPQGAKEIPVAPEITTLVVPEGGGLFRTVLLWIDVPVQTPTA